MTQTRVVLADDDVLLREGQALGGVQDNPGADHIPVR